MIAAVPGKTKHHCLAGPVKNSSLWKYQKNEPLQSILSHDGGPGGGVSCRRQQSFLSA